MFECAGTACGEDFGKLTYSNDNPDTRIVVDKVNQTRGYLIEAMLEYVKDVRYALLKKTTLAGDSYVAVYIASMTGGSLAIRRRLSPATSDVLIERSSPSRSSRKSSPSRLARSRPRSRATSARVLRHIYFDFNKADLKPESDAQLAEMANYLAKSTARMFVVGHTDNVSELDYNLALSQKRAQAVVAALTGKYKDRATARLTARSVARLSTSPPTAKTQAAPRTGGWRWWNREASSRRVRNNRAPTGTAPIPRLRRRADGRMRRRPGTCRRVSADASG